jgi:hypothetical protein
LTIQIAHEQDHGTLEFEEQRARAVSESEVTFGGMARSRFYHRRVVRFLREPGRFSLSL